MNAALGVLFLALLAPVLGTWGDLTWYVRAAFVLFGLPFALLGVGCLVSAARPGSVGRALRRLRRR